MSENTQDAQDMQVQEQNQDQNIPEQVIEAGRKADELAKQMLDQANEAAEPDKKEDSTADQKDQDTEKSAQDAGSDTEAQEQQGEQQADQGEGAEKSKDDETEESLEQRLKTLQGKYNHEVPMLAHSLQEANSKVNAAQAENAELKRKLEELQKASEGEQAKPQDVLNPEDFEDYGPEIVRLAQTLNGVAAENQRLKAEAQQQVEQSAPQQQQQPQNDQLTRLIDEVKTMVPDFDAKNDDPVFINHLQTTVNTQTGRTMFETLNEAASGGDSKWVASIFNNYFNSNKVSTTQTQSVSEPTPQADTNLQKQVSPNKSKARTSPAGPEKTWTKQDIRDAYAEMTKGNMTPEDIANKEKEIRRAFAEGRVSG